jgi:hypothetical protein
MAETFELIAAARDVLAQLYVSQSSASTVAFTAGLDPSRIPFKDRAVDTWQAIVTEAHNRGRVLQLLDIALKQYPEKVDLQQIRAAWAAHEKPACVVEIQNSDVLDFRCDVLALKYAGALYGADEAVAERMGSDFANRLPLHPGSHLLVPTQGVIKADYALFVGVAPLWQFDYQGIRDLARRALEITASQKPDTRHLAMTIHGVGAGLDETEAFLAQIGGWLDAFAAGNVPANLEKITVVDRDQRRVDRLHRALDAHLPGGALQTVRARNVLASPDRITGAGMRSNEKPHIFVALPSTAEMEDVFVLGIQESVESAGYLCEKLDLTGLDPEVLKRARSRIDTAALVIADLTGANPGAYLGIGYAWGRKRPTLLLVKKGPKAKFDIPDQPCLAYVNVTDLRKKLKADLQKYIV